MLARKRGGKNHIGRSGKDICCAFHKAELRAYLKKRRFYAGTFRFDLLSPYDRMNYDIAHPGDGLDFRNVPDGIRETIGKCRKHR